MYVSLYAFRPKPYILNFVQTWQRLSLWRHFVGFVGEGDCHSIYSDNGTHFQGARNEIRELQSLMTSKSTDTALSHCSTSSIKCHFSSPRVPHFGGLWEVAVKSMKLLLRKIVGPHTLTYQELTTVLIEAEATLNSRPLTPISSTSDDCWNTNFVILELPIIISRFTYYIILFCVLRVRFCVACWFLAWS